MQKINIAIDGPAGAGKSTIAKLVAARLGFLYVDTGAMYRAMTVKALRQGVDLNNDAALENMANNTSVRLVLDPGKNQQVFLDDEEVTVEIREPIITQNVSRVSAVPGLRERLVGLQQQMGEDGGVVMDGRDIGTKVLPNAQVKFFMTASIAERAKRRYLELVAKGLQVELNQIEQELALRDKLDSERAVSPLVKADDAELVDTSNLNIEQVVELLVQKIAQYGAH